MCDTQWPPVFFPIHVIKERNLLPDILVKFLPIVTTFQQFIP